LLSPSALLAFSDPHTSSCSHLDLVWQHEHVLLRSIPCHRQPLSPTQRGCNQITCADVGALLQHQLTGMPHTAQQQAAQAFSSTQYRAMGVWPRLDAQRSCTI
jgi:hypothetical protein